MSGPDVAAAARNDWAPANPWTWAVVGLLASGLALAWVRLWGEQAPAVRYLLILLGLLCSGGAVALRLSAARTTSFLDGLPPALRSLALTGLAAAGAILALGATALLAAVGLKLDIPWGPAEVIAVWLLAFPAGAGVLVYALTRRGRHAFSAAAESAVVLLGGAASAFLACWALYVDEEHALDWDTIRLFLAVTALAATAFAGLVLLSRTWRRRAVAALILFHFGGIACSALSPSPSPWIIQQQLWTRVYRPYLQFMYLVNAYHFYAPDPGPANYLFCRIHYRSAQGKDHWRWVKVPDLNEEGQHGYAAALAYQRRLALLDNARGYDNPPPFFAFTKQGNTIIQPVYYWRAFHSPTPLDAGKGKSARPKLAIPFHPDVNPWQTQYLPASLYFRHMMSSYASHLTHTFADPEHPDDQAVGVKIYWTVHTIPMRVPLAEGLDPMHPAMFHPYYMGEYDREGTLLDEPAYDENGNMTWGDPFLFWLIPTYPDNVHDNQSAVWSWMRRHAGDPNWYRPYGKDEWTAPPPTQATR